jgi:hypothetical protein
MNNPTITIQDPEKGPIDVTLGELMAKLRLGIKVTELTVFCGEKYKHPTVQYESKDYGSTMRFDMASVYEILDQVSDEDKPEVRRHLGHLVRQQVVDCDNFQRENLRHCALRDGIPEAGVDIQNRRHNNAKELGRQAARDGRAATDNPYVSQTEDGSVAVSGPLSEAWQEGWNEIQKQ